MRTDTCEEVEGADVHVTVGKGQRGVGTFITSRPFSLRNNLADDVRIGLITMILKSHDKGYGGIVCLLWRNEKYILKFKE